MAKTLLKKELVFLDFKSKKFQFYNIEVISIGYNDIQVIFNYGKLGNKGREQISRIRKKDRTYKEAMKKAYRKIYDIKSKGYISVEKMELGIKHAMKQESAENWKSKNKKDKRYKCDFCDTPINQQLYEKINKWGREQGNWDYDKNSPLYKKVICLDCQIEKEIFQKRLDEDTEIITVKNKGEKNEEV